jgi:hypothetical protein
MNYDLARSADGMTIHRADCRYAKPEGRWLWAAEQTDPNTVKRAIREFGYRTCKICRPIPD